MQTIRTAAGWFVLAAGFASPVVLAQAPTSTPTTNKVEEPAIVNAIQVAPGALQGRVLDATARQPISAHSMQVLDASGKKVEALVTDKDGGYRTAALQPGRYALVVRGDLQMDLLVTQASALKTVDILLPPEQQGPQQPARKLVPQDPKQVPAAPGGAAPKQIPVGGIGTGTWAMIGAGAAAAVAVPVVATQGKSETSVSASGSQIRR